MSTATNRTLPDGWERVTVGNLGNIVAGGTPSRNNVSYWNGAIPWVTPGEITQLPGKYVDSTVERISQAGLAGSAARLLPENSIVVTTRATLGEAAITAVPLATNQGFKNIIPDANSDPRFTYYAVQTLRREMERLASGTTFLEISKSDFERITLIRPQRVDDQERLATILDVLDAAIAQSEAELVKLRHVRAGLLHDLLTRGLDENDELRDPVAHPEKFASSPLGQVPVDWVVEPLDHFLARTEYGISTSLSGDGQLPVLRMNNLANGEAVVDDIKFATSAVPQALLLRDGDVLFNRTNSYEHVGRTGIWRDQLPVATFASYLVRLNPIPGRISAEFLNWLLNMPESQKRMRAFATPAVQQVNINPTNLRKMFVAVPRETAEQNRITDATRKATQSVSSLDIEVQKLKDLRSALSNDLLTGRVRVPAGLELA